MKKSILALMMVSACFSTVANANPSEYQQEIDLDMAQLTQVDAQVFVVEEVDQDHVQLSAHVETEFSEVYISKQQAHELGLEKSAHFHVGGKANIVSLAEAIALKIRQDDPTFFSVEMYRQYNRVNDTHIFAAKVIEYK
ncbi:hypothetical protein [Shewanella gaetbuli]|uniref:Uncharacterized protein n=1 Tax=Shewanella gaetbuli TaxID=220752 RepID=A0A9X2CMI5_9GAMM|nr:hypothetical protein [Shewanella gaetbuli]MCL1143720.1 hypothetical protein [Shewanella gaetbuli]